VYAAIAIDSCATIALCAIIALCTAVTDTRGQLAANL
jgi:hypothetical protein